MFQKTMAGLYDEDSDGIYEESEFYTGRGERSKVCEPCNVGNNMQPATGWCETCNEMLCNDCYESHCRLKITRHHQLMSLEEMMSPKKTKKVASRCQTHVGKKLKYYCEDHAELGCSQCFVSKHRVCRKVVCISEQATRECNEFHFLHFLLSKLMKKAAYH